MFVLNVGCPTNIPDDITSVITTDINQISSLYSTTNTKTLFVGDSTENVFKFLPDLFKSDPYDCFVKRGFTLGTETVTGLADGSATPSVIYG